MAALEELAAMAQMGLKQAAAVAELVPWAMEVLEVEPLEELAALAVVVMELGQAVWGAIAMGMLEVFQVAEARVLKQVVRKIEWAAAAAAVE